MKAVFKVTASRVHQGIRKLRTFENKKPELTKEQKDAGWVFVSAARAAVSPVVMEAA